MVAKNRKAIMDSFNAGRGPFLLSLLSLLHASWALWRDSHPLRVTHADRTEDTVPCSTCRSKFSVLVYFLSGEARSTSVGD